MQQKIDEMTILKATSIKLDNDKILVLSFQYHVEKGNRDASRYRYLGRIYNIEDLKEEIINLKSDENRLNPWIWPNDPSWNGKICTNDSINSRASDFLRMKLKKALDWDLGQKVLKGFKISKNEYNLNAAYELENYTASDGTILNLTDKEVLISKVGQNIVKEVVLKSKNSI